MLENELNDAEPSGEERSGAHSPQIDTAEAAGPPPAPVAGDGDAPAAKGRRRATRRPAKESGTDAAPPDAPPSAPGVASPGPDAAGPSAIRFASPAAEASAASGAPARAAEPAGTAARAGTAAPAATGAQAGSVPAATFQPPQVIFQPPPQGETGDAGGRGRKAAGADDDGPGGRSRKAAGADDEGPGGDGQQAEHDDGEPDGQGRRRRRRGGRSRGQSADAEAGIDKSGNRSLFEDDRTFRRSEIAGGGLFDILRQPDDTVRIVAGEIRIYQMVTGFRRDFGISAEAPKHG